MRAVVLAIAIAVAACGGDRKPGPVDPVASAPPDAAWCDDVIADVDLPAVPSFALPTFDDGTHSVRELQVDGDRLLDSDLTVRGYVTWIYDCVDANRGGDLTDDELRKRIAEEPDRYCRKPQLRIATDLAEAPDGILIVNVPRHPTAIEKKLLPKEELANKEIWRPVPPLQVGDEVVITGTWTQRTYGGVDLDGLIDYDTLINVTRGWPAR